MFNGACICLSAEGWTVIVEEEDDGGEEAAESFTAVEVVEAIQKAILHANPAAKLDSTFIHVEPCDGDKLAVKKEMASEDGELPDAPEALGGVVLCEIDLTDDGGWKETWTNENVPIEVCQIPPFRSRT